METIYIMDIAKIHLCETYLLHFHRHKSIRIVLQGIVMHDGLVCVKITVLNDNSKVKRVSMVPFQAKVSMPTEFDSILCFLPYILFILVSFLLNGTDATEHTFLTGSLGRIVII